MLQVFITVDNEVYPLLPDWRETRLAGDIARDIDGHTSAGDFGLKYQLQAFNEHNLKAVYFVEPLFASAVGLDPLRRIVDVVQGHGQEVQLHVHPEWLEQVPESIWPGRRANTIREFSEDEQTELIGIALDNLRRCGAKHVTAFRAGDYAANSDTLRAVRRNGIIFDSSYNLCYLHPDFDTHTDQPLVQPAMLEGVHEFPVSFFSDWPGHYRHAQITACSYAELTHALMEAWRREWFSFVIVFHSMELLMNRRRRLNNPRADFALVRRFRRLCEFLACNRDKFDVTNFNAINIAQIPKPSRADVIHSSPIRTAKRFAEQGIRRLKGKVMI